MNIQSENPTSLSCLYYLYPFIRDLRAAKPGKVCKTLETMSVPTFLALSTKACKTVLVKVRPD